MQSQQQPEDEIEDGFLAIGLGSDSDSETSKQRKKEETSKLPRDHQSEENFQQQLKAWRPKIEFGELHKSLILPMNNPSKPESQKILHAIEELYFEKRYEDALGVVERVMEGELQVEFRGTLERYRKRILVRLGRDV